MTTHLKNRPHKHGCKECGDLLTDNCTCPYKKLFAGVCSKCYSDEDNTSDPDETLELEF